MPVAVPDGVPTRRAPCETRPGGPAVEKLTQSVEEYLEAVFKLTRDGSPATVGQVAAALDVSPPSVSEMVRRLRSAGACGRRLAAAVSPDRRGPRRGRPPRAPAPPQRALPRGPPRHAVGRRPRGGLQARARPQPRGRGAARGPARQPADLSARPGDPRRGRRARRGARSARCRRWTPATPARSAASPRRRRTFCAISLRSACCPTPRSRSRASPRSAAPSWCASPGPSTRSDARWRARSWSAADDGRLPRV